MNSLTKPIINIWKWWFDPRSTNPTVAYRERALRVLLPIIILLRVLGTIQNYSGAPDQPEPYAPLWVSLSFFIIPIFFSFYFLARKQVGWAGAFFILHWYLIDMLSLPAEGYWYAGYQISIIIQAVLGTLLLPSRAILPFMIFQLSTVGIWGNWLDVNHYDPPLLSSGQPVAIFWRVFITLAAQESVIVFIVRYLRLQMEKSLRLQQVSIQQLEEESAERYHAEARLRGIFENSPGLILELDRDGTILLANRYAESYEGKNVRQFVLPEHREIVGEAIAQAFETGENLELELQTAERDGTFQWNSIHTGPVLSGSRVTSLVVISANIHAQKEAALRASQHARQLATIIEIGHAVSTLWDLGSILEIIYQQVQLIAPVDAFFIGLYDRVTNQLTFPLTYDMGIRYDEPGGEMRPDTRLAKVIRSGKPHRIHRTAEEIAEAEKDERGVGNAQRKSGSLLFVPLWQADEVIGVLSIQSYTLNAYPDELVETLAGIGDQAASAIQNARLFTSVQQELAERKRAEEKTTQSANQLSMLNEIGRAVAALTDLDSVLETVFQQVAQVIPLDVFFVTLYDPLTNRVSHPLVYEQGKRWDEPDTELTPGTNISHVIQTGESVLRLPSADEFERTRQSRPGMFGDRSMVSASLMFVPMTIKGRLIGVISVQNYAINAYTAENLKLLEGVANQVAIAIENARLFTSVQRELAERKQAEAEVHKLNESLQQQVAELERFTYTVSHDLKSPLVTIKGFLGMLKRDLQENNQHHIQKDFERISEAADKMGTLLSELLELSRIGRIVNPPEEVDLVKLTQDALETLDGRIRERNVTVTISPDLPIVYADRNRLREVLENLIDNAAKYMGGQASPLIEIGKRESGTETIIYIKDNGIGIEPQFHTKIFGLFEKLSATSEGTGIGLALVKRIIEVHGGRIWVESEGLGKGCVFCFTIPDTREKFK